ncbi:MAG: hypothetical protein E7324_07680 [Clostridiales bacterium]|nr:hypothetical protein [Clostridiales bacterium]
MKKGILLLLALCMLALPCVAEEAKLLPDEWMYVGYTNGGVTFPIPENLEIAQLTAQEQAAGIILVGYHWDITLQLRVFSPEVMTWEDFKTTIEAEATADVQFLGADGSILYYRNTAPSASSELAGIALTGLDGRLYKISVFTGMMEDFSPEAKVWEMAELIAAHTSQMDFSQWPLKEQQ